MTNRPEIIILSGLPACGKSTMREHIIDSLSDDFPVYVHSTDDLIEAYARELDMTYDDVYAEYNREASAIAKTNLREAIQNRNHIMVDQTMLSVKARRRPVGSISPREYKRTCVCILPPYTPAMTQEWRRRLGDRPGKTIPDHVLDQMINWFQLPTTNEGFNKVLYFDLYGQPVDRNDAADLFGEL